MRISDSSVMQKFFEKKCVCFGWGARTSVHEPQYIQVPDFDFIQKSASLTLCCRQPRCRLKSLPTCFPPQFVCSVTLQCSQIFSAACSVNGKLSLLSPQFICIVTLVLTDFLGRCSVGHCSVSGCSISRYLSVAVLVVVVVPIGRCSVGHRSVSRALSEFSCCQATR